MLRTRFAEKLLSPVTSTSCLMFSVLPSDVVCRITSFCPERSFLLLRSNKALRKSLFKTRGVSILVKAREAVLVVGEGEDRTNRCLARAIYFFVWELRKHSFVIHLQVTLFHCLCVCLVLLCVFEKADKSSVDHRFPFQHSGKKCCGRSSSMTGDCRASVMKDHLQLLRWS